MHRIPQIICAFVLLASSAFAQATVPFAQCADGECANRRTVTESPQSQSVPLPARCRVRCGDGKLGSGTLVCSNDNCCTVVTAWHVVKDSNGQVSVEFPQGGRFNGTIAAKDEFYDLAAINIAACDIEPLPLGDDLAGTLAAGGFGGDGVFRSIHGTVSGYVFYGKDTNTEQMPVITGGVRPGDSGGAVTNSNRQMVGVVWGTLNGQTYITAGSPLRKLVQQVCGNHSQNLLPITPIQPRPPVPQQPPQVAPQPAPQPQIDWATKYEKLESDFAGLQLKFDALQKQVANYKECQCGDCMASVDAKIAVAIAGIKIPQPTPQQPPNYDAIAAEISKRLPPINMRVTPEAPYQSVKLGSYVTLPLDKQNP